MALVKKGIDELLLENGLISPEQWEEARIEKEKTGEPMSLILARLGMANENQVKNALELQYGVNYVALKKVETVAPDCIKLLPEDLMRRHQVAITNKDGNRVSVAMVNPNNLIALDDIKMRLKGMQIKLSVCTEDDFQSFMESVYSDHLTAEDKKESEEEAAERKKKEEEDEAATADLIEKDVDLSQMDILAEEMGEDGAIQALEAGAADAPIIKLANQILAKAIKTKISTIHVEPQEKYVAVRYRRDGILVSDRVLPKALMPALVSRYKIMSDLNISERRLPQDGRFHVRLAGQDIDLRVSTLPCKFGEKVVMRVLDKSNTKIGMAKLITDPDARALVKDMIDKPFGIIFVTGPTGSGKTTTLYVCLGERNKPDVNISTAEDPIEYDMAGITQCQVIREKGMDFARILRAFLRQDPDIMLVGETRDKETAKIAIEAALTGHLVFTTLHTNDAPGAISRLAEMEVEPFLIASATLGIVAQRLIRRVCNKCKEEYVPERKILEYVGLIEPGEEKLAQATIDYFRFKVNADGWPLFWKGKGCDECNNTGYHGRLGCFEVMKMNDELRDLIVKGAPVAIVRTAAKNSGMVPLKEYSLRLVGEGVTTPEECIRVTISDTAGEEVYCPGCRKVIADDFVRCPYCLYIIKVYCENCGTLWKESWVSCSNCGLSKAQAKRDLICAGCEATIEGRLTVCPYCQTSVEISLARASATNN